MDYICGVTFAPFAPGKCLVTKEAKESLTAMKERTNANFVMFVPNALQDTPQSETITTGEESATREELTDIVLFAKEELGLRVALKPTVNCKNGTWRAFINFFDEDVVCEPKWGNWFKSYTEFQLKFAEIAQDLGCEMFIPGCEMVMSERREDEWRKLISDLRGVYKGLISYNTDKYQEHNVKWWDAVDVISSSGYYPLGTWKEQLDRIEKVVKKYNKPFFFAESGCMSTEGSKFVPNNWCLEGGSDPDGQKEWYSEMFAACEKRDWINGICLWDWPIRLYKAKDIDKYIKYEFYEKPAEAVIKDYFGKKR